MATKAPITCHVLDTLTGQPAVEVYVNLSCTSYHIDGLWFTETTDDDGRITHWKSVDDNTTVESVLAHVSKSGESTWKLEFNTGNYYGKGKTFWPKVELSFVVKPGEHYHVPLLLGPYSFTTYRGS